MSVLHEFDRWDGAVRLRLRTGLFCAARGSIHSKANSQIVSVYAGCKQIELALQPYGRETNHAVEP